MEIVFFSRNKSAAAAINPAEQSKVSSNQEQNNVKSQYFGY